MNTIRRPLFAVLATCLALVALTGGTSAVAAASLTAETDGRSAAASRSAASARAPGPCADAKFNLYPGMPRWVKTLRWSYRGSSTPSYLSRAAVVQVLQRAFQNITSARNDCGRDDNVSATSAYDGITTRKPSVGGYGNCTRGDGLNVIGFGDLPPGALAVACTRWNDNDQIIEADIRISSRVHWATTKAACAGSELLEPTVTHELGHAYGLGHVSERRHGRLTMSTISDGSCSNAESTLGFGDMLGLEQLY